MLKLGENEFYIGEVSKKKKQFNGRGMIINLQAGSIALGLFRNGYPQFKTDLEGDFVFITDFNSKANN